ncbi:MAG: hypothetical protein K0B15_07025 [Lentimicrobium sp.]|nr:hypothetical protein [Lentimicrobium sp.]
MNDLATKPLFDLSQKSFCIAIGGVSRSGKTFLAEMLGNFLVDSLIIHQDKYIPDKKDIPTIKDHIDWERPEAIDWKAFRNAIVHAKQSFKYVIVEGLFVFLDENINQYYDRHIFISLSKEVFLKRKKEDHRWGVEPDWYIEHIWEGHITYGNLPEVIQKPLIINGVENFNLHNIIQQLNLPG